MSAGWRWFGDEKNQSLKPNEILHWILIYNRLGVAKPLDKMVSIIKKDNANCQVISSQNHIALYKYPM